MSNLLVTGGAGFIGANFVHHWLAGHPDDRVVVLDALTYAGHRESLRDAEGEARFRFVHGDIRDTELVAGLLDEEGTDTVVHFAAESHVDRSILGPDAFIQTNVMGTYSLLQAAARVWLAGDGHPHRFHHVSTDEVYGTLGPNDPAFREDTPYAPNSPYAASKAASDHLVRAWHHTYGLQVTTSNCSNNYGPFHYPEKLIPLMILNALGGKRLPVYGDGSNIRDWLFVADHCRGIEAVIECGEPGETYNVGGNAERTNLDLVGALCGAIDAMFASDASLADAYPRCPAAQGGETGSLVEFVKDRPGHDFRYAIDASKARVELGWSPKVSVEEGLRATVRWYLDNAWWTQAVATDLYDEWVRRQYAG